MKKYKLRSGSNIHLDTLDNVIHSSDFESVLGKITSEFRFIPNGKICVEQGLTSEMLIFISQLIKERAGIGKKKAEPEKAEPEKAEPEKAEPKKAEPRVLESIHMGSVDKGEYTLPI